MNSWIIGDCRDPVNHGPPDVGLRMEAPSVAKEQALGLPVAYDSAWRASSGEVGNAGGLLAIVGVDQPQVTLEFVPDLVAVLRALSMTLAQVLAVGGFLGLAYLRPTPEPADSRPYADTSTEL